MQLAWLTDLHLNFVEPDPIDPYLRAISSVPYEGVLLSGDIGEATSVIHYLRFLDTWFNLPIYFVLGNHDFYRESITGVRQKVVEMCATSPNLHWLPMSGVVQLTESTGLIGHDGWGDGRHGDYWGLKVQLNDWGLIQEFRWLDHHERLEKLNQLGEEAADHFKQVLPDALTRFQHIIVVTHVPPFQESCWHEGKISDDDWLPHFTCKAVGDVLKEVMAKHPDRQMTVLCGHTHGAGEAQILPNLKVLTGGAEYGNPVLQQVLEVM